MFFLKLLLSVSPQFYLFQLKLYLKGWQDKWPLGRKSDRSWYHRHTTSMIKLFWLQPWLHGYQRHHTDKVKSSRPSLQTEVKLGTSGHLGGTWTGAGVTATLVKNFLYHSPWIHELSGSTLVCCHQGP